MLSYDAGVSPRVLAPVLALLAACVPNPRFLLDATTDTGASGETDTTGETPASAGSTSDTPTDTTGATGTGTGTGGGSETTAGVTSVATTTGTTGTTGTTDLGTSDLDTSEVGSGDSTSSGESSSGDPASCGDGVPDDGEQCDDGPDNDDEGACTSACMTAFCGDGLLRTHGDDPEKCDDGPGNGTGLGKCSNDCAVVIPMKTHKIVVVSGATGTLHVPGSQVVSGIAAGDDACKIKVDEKYKILVADGLSRVASKTPWTGDGQANWVLKPYTGYTDGGGALLGITGKEALLGIQNGTMVGLGQTITGGQQRVWTGLLSSWIAAPTNCSNWTTSNPVKTAMTGNSGLLDGYLDGFNTISCLEPQKIYCVEQ